MAKFIYKMENLLNIKNKLEEEAKNVYGTAMFQLNLEEEKLQGLQLKREEYETNLTRLCTSKLDIMAIKKCEDAIEVTKYHIKLQQVAVNNAKLQLEKARVKLSEAMIERKTHEKLKENAFESFKEELKGQEMKEVDELVSFRFKNGSGSEVE